jgi:uncharacterized membrane protein YdjX (TVP38/TMEM64 family)
MMPVERPVPADNTARPAPWWPRLLFLAMIAAAIVAFYALGLAEELTWQALQTRRAALQEQVAAQPLLAVVIFALIYVAATTLVLPISAPLSMTAGALFGRALGLLIVSFVSTTGAAVAFLLCRYLFRDAVERRWGARLAPIQRGVEREGIYYLLTLRLSPVVPFTWINLAMGLTRMPLWTFWWVSQLGMLPIGCILVNIGAELGAVESPGDIMSLSLIVSMSLGALVPLALRFLWKGLTS